VGTPDDYHTNGSGSAYVFQLVSGVWFEKAKLLASDTYFKE
jgi:hypothetical protein